MIPRIVKDFNDVFGDIDLLKCSIYANASVEIDQRCLAHFIGNFILFNFFDTMRAFLAFMTDWPNQLAVEKEMNL